MTQIWYLEENFKYFYPIQHFTYTSFQYNSLDYFCIYGGYSVIGNNYGIVLYELFRLDIENLEWNWIVTITPVQYPDMSLVQHYNGSIYITNIIDGYAYIAKYNIYSGEIIFLNSVYTSSEILMAVSVDRYIYIGLTNQYFYRIDFNSVDLALENAGQFEYPTSASAVCSFNNGFSYFGGFWYTNLNSIFMLWFDQNNAINWQYTDNYISTKARLSHSFNQINSLLYLFGGKDNNNCFNDLWTFDTDTLIWLFIDTTGNFFSTITSCSGLIWRYFTYMRRWKFFRIIKWYVYLWFFNK